MKQLRSMLALKITVFVLLIVMAITAAGSGILLIYGYEEGIFGNQVWYHNGARQESDNTFYATGRCRSLAYNAGAYVSRTQLEGLDAQQIFAGDYYSFDFTIRETDENGALLANTIRPDGSYGLRIQERHSYVDEGEDKTHYVEIAVTDPLRGTDEFYEANLIYQMIVRAQPFAVPVLVISLVLMLLCTIFLFSAAGHKKGREGIVLNALDRIPLDIYAAVMFGMAIVPMFGLGEIGLSFYNWLLYVVLLGAALTWTGILGIGLLLSVATRLKAGKWWRNSVIYRLGRWLLRNGKRILTAIGRGIHALPMIWRTVLIAPAVILIDVMLIAMGRWNAFMAFIAFLFNVLILGCICFAALQLRKLQKTGKALAGGNFEAKIDTKRMFWDFKKHGENLNAIGEGMAIAVEQRMRSERLKTELITNVSHDIKTPLTSIVNYVDLLQKQHTDEEQAQYLDVLARQSARLKKLTEDLVEASKVSTGNVAANLVRTNVAEIVNQALGEYAERLTAGNLTVVTDLPDGEVPVKADGRLLWRILDNLLSNVCKYAMAGTRVYVSVQRGGETVIAVKNISRQPLNVSAEELLERFVRGDAARSTEGSGLGLSIARSLTELQGGTFTLFVDGDFFRAEVRLPGVFAATQFGAI